MQKKKKGRKFGEKGRAKSEEKTEIIKIIKTFVLFCFKIKKKKAKKKYLNRKWQKKKQKFICKITVK